MGYNTTFSGELKIEPELNSLQRAYLSAMLGQDCREHSEWDEAYQSIPEEYKSKHDRKVTQLTWMDFELRHVDTIAWNGSEKSYDMTTKVNLIIALMREIMPEFSLSGHMDANGEEVGDIWRLEIDDNGWAKTIPMKAMAEAEVRCPNCLEKFIPENE